MKTDFEILVICICGMCFLFFMSVSSRIYFNIELLNSSENLLKAWFETKSSSGRSQLIHKAKQKVQIYNRKMKDFFLEEGMLINRDSLGRVNDRCDSLLFSSLRIVALTKLSMEKEAKEAWEGVLAAYAKEKKWVRHPKCKQPLSKDMFLGLMSVMSQQIGQKNQKLLELSKYISSHQGYFDKGPVYLSYLTPPLKRLFDQILILNRHEPTDFFSLNITVVEFETLFLNEGYKAHLLALYLWLSHELDAISMKLQEEPPEKSQGLSTLMEAFGFSEFERKKRACICTTICRNRKGATSAH